MLPTLAVVLTHFFAKTATAHALFKCVFSSVLGLQCDNQSLLHEACNVSNLESIAELLGRGADADLCDVSAPNVLSAPPFGVQCVGFAWGAAGACCAHRICASMFCGLPTRVPLHGLLRAC